MKRIHLTIILSLVLIALIILSFTISKDKEKQRSVCTSDGKCINVEIADTESERQLGLMNRDNLNSDSGMLFIFEKPGNYPFWMKNTLIPLDILWLDGSGKVVYIANAVPCATDVCENYNPSANAKYVLEINAGKSEELGIKVGDNLSIN